MVDLGIETGDPAMYEEISKRLNIEYVTEFVGWINKWLAACVLVRHRSDGWHFGNESHRGKMTLLNVIYVQAVMIES